MQQTKYVLGEDRIPTHWYNVLADFPEPSPPPLHPGTKQPATAADMAAIFCEPIIDQEMSGERWITIPNEVREILALFAKLADGGPAVITVTHERDVAKRAKRVVTLVDGRVTHA